MSDNKKLEERVQQMSDVGASQFEVLPSDPTFVVRPNSTNEYIMSWRNKVRASSVVNGEFNCIHNYCSK